MGFPRADVRELPVRVGSVNSHYDTELPPLSVRLILASQLNAARARCDTADVTRVARRGLSPTWPAR